MTRARLCVLLLAACGGDDAELPGIDADPVDACASPPTWDTFARPLLDTWCNACHGSEVEGALRSGAPVDVALDDYVGAVAWGARIAERTYGPTGGMPPSGQISAEDLALLEEWINCGMPGEPSTSTHACDVRVPHAGDVVVGAGDDPCAGGWNAIDGDLAVEADVSLSCLCDVTGDVAVGGAATALDAPALQAIGGDLTTTGATALGVLTLPALTRIDGDLVLRDLPADEVTVEQLASVGGSVIVLDVPALRALGLPRLESVGGDLRLEACPLLADADSLRGLATVGGDIVLDGLPALTGDPYRGFDALLRISSVGGSVHVSGTGIVALWSFQELADIPGSLHIGANGALEELGGLHELATVGGRVMIEENPYLRTIVALPALTSIGAGKPWPEGGLVIRDNRSLEALPALPALATLQALDVLDCETLVAIDGFGGLLTALPGGLRLVGNEHLEGVTSFTALASVGELLVDDDPALSEIPLPALESAANVTIARTGLPAVYGIGELEDVTGTLTIAENPALTSLIALDVVTVAGDVIVQDNPALPQAGAQAVVDAIPSVGGSRTVTGNGP